MSTAARWILGIAGAIELDAVFGSLTASNGVATGSGSIEGIRLPRTTTTFAPA